MKNNKEFKNWLTDLQLAHPLLIAGPCSAETEEQVMNTAIALKETTDTNVFRAGIWKPRTRPGGFEGVGEKGLKWIQKVKDELGMMTAIEVGNKDHVEKALKYDIDVLWIGARTTVNPFVVQEIADALKGSDRIILVKNPVNPDLPLWMGAVERIYNAGITKLGVIHRGFSTYKSTKYRNKPQWQIAIELKKEYPDLPLIIDPSHICGRRDTLFDVSQTALDLNYDGLMIETHTDPDNAWSDAKQQITPKTLNQLTQDLKIRDEKSDKAQFVEQLEIFRKELDTVDENLIKLLKERMDVSTKIGKLKHKENVSILQNDRWEKVLEGVINEGKSFDLSEEFIMDLFRKIHVESIKIQHTVSD